MKGGSRRAEKSCKMLLRMKAAKLIVGRSRSREGAGLEKEQGQEGQKQGRTGAGQK